MKQEIGPQISGACAPEDIEDFLEAAEEFERTLELEPGLVLRNLTQMLRKRAGFEVLRSRFDCRQRQMCSPPQNAGHL